MAKELKIGEKAMLTEYAGATPYVVTLVDWVDKGDGRIVLLVETEDGETYSAYESQLRPI
jgi:hypothetical protein